MFKEEKNSLYCTIFAFQSNRTSETMRLSVKWVRP